MANTYEIMGRVIQPHQLAVATIGAVALIALPNPFACKKEKVAEIKGKSPEEDKFIKEYLEAHKLK
ncbi:hypothetical protein NCAS_0B05320 [Naumovozyma castellii]|uniref:ATP synthase subunit K, mitochondrial n=1 Tax=Naumovozyma castellii TaxID=27288 RepID=G0V9K0_NAUCA|nr:hypothetical protein NCAS_0B05320 [Naumovozyma castellii CBS 4309]CCC68616.1 hypothetical protein NCAS_0B05320 [Naumovozyma castellii CBS 4309]